MSINLYCTTTAPGEETTVIRSAKVPSLTKYLLALCLERCTTTSTVLYSSTVRIKVRMKVIAVAMDRSLVHVHSPAVTDQQLYS